MNATNERMARLMVGVGKVAYAHDDRSELELHHDLVLFERLLQLTVVNGFDESGAMSLRIELLKSGASDRALHLARDACQGISATDYFEVLEIRGFGWMLSYEPDADYANGVH